MTRPRLRLLVLLASLGVGCGERVLHSELPALQFARADVLEAQRGAPDLYARAEQARAQALAADDADAQADHTQRARLWLAAALAESRRIEQARATSAAEARIVAAETQRVAIERERSGLEETAQRAESARRTHEQLVRAFDLADRDSLAGSGRDRALDPARVQAAALLQARATLILAAAVALGLDAERASSAAAAGNVRSNPRNAFEQLARARNALSRAESALGEARAALPGPSADERAALVELATARGLAPRSTERGAVLALDRAFGAGAALTPDGRRTVLAIADVLRAHPHGPVQLQVLLGSSANAAAQQLGKTRGSKLLAALQAAVTAPDRIRIVDQTGDAPAIVLPAYAASSPVASSVPVATSP